MEEDPSILEEELVDVLIRTIESSNGDIDSPASVATLLKRKAIQDILRQGQTGVKGLTPLEYAATQGHHTIMMKLVDVVPHSQDVVEKAIDIYSNLPVDVIYKAYPRFKWPKDVKEKEKKAEEFRFAIIDYLQKKMVPGPSAGGKRRKTKTRKNKSKSKKRSTSKTSRRR